MPITGLSASPNENLRPIWVTSMYDLSDTSGVQFGLNYGQGFLYVLGTVAPQVSVEFLGNVARDFWVEYFGVLRGCENDWALEIEESAIERLKLWVKMLKP